jgi:hypothetical protein
MSLIPFFSLCRTDYTAWRVKLHLVSFIDCNRSLRIPKVLVDIRPITFVVCAYFLTALGFTSWCKARNVTYAIYEYWKGVAWWTEAGTGTRAAAALDGRVQEAATLVGKLTLETKKKYFILPRNFKCLSQIKRNCLNHVKGSDLTK